MRKLMGYASDFIRKMTVWDVGLLKICLLALGVLVGTALPQRYKRTALVSSSIAFCATYVPLMTKFLLSVCRSDRESTKACKTKACKTKA